MVRGLLALIERSRTGWTRTVHGHQAPHPPRPRLQQDQETPACKPRRKPIRMTANRDRKMLLQRARMATLRLWGRLHPSSRAW